MAERTKGGGFRERIYFDDGLWQDIEACADHMRLEPRELVKMLTAMGLAQMKGLTMMAAMQEAVKPAIQQALVDDFERNTGISADTPVMGSASPRRATGQSGGMSAPGRSGSSEGGQLARTSDHGSPSYMKGL